MMKIQTILQATSVVFFFACTPALAQNAGSVPTNAIPVGKGVGTGFGSISGNQGALVTSATGVPSISTMITLPNQSGSGSYRALNASGAAKDLLLLGDSATAANSTRLRGAGGAVTIEKSNGDAIASFMESGSVGITGPTNIAGALSVIGPFTQTINSGSQNSIAINDSNTGGQVWNLGPAVGTGSANTFALYSGGVLQKWNKSTGLSTIPGSLTAGSLGSFWTDVGSGITQHHRFQDRVFIGDGIYNVGTWTYPQLVGGTGASSVINTVGWNWGPRESTLSVIGSNGGIAISGMAVGSAGGTIGTSGYFFGDTAIAGWGSYFECAFVHASSGCSAIEIDVGNVSGVEANWNIHGGPFNSNGIGIAAGGSLQGNYLTGHPYVNSTIGLSFASNLARFFKGIGFAPDSLVDMGGGRGDALNLANMHYLNWWRSNGAGDGQQQAFIRATNTTPGTAFGSDVQFISFDAGGVTQLASRSLAFGSPDAATNIITVGYGATGNRTAAVNFGAHSGSTTDLQIVRNSGINGTADIINNGTGHINLTTASASSHVKMNPNGVAVLDASSTGVSIAGLTVTGSFTATGLLHVADLATASQSTTVNGQTCALAGSCTVTATATAALTFGTHLTSGGSSYNGSAAVTITSDATNANTASTIVARDGSGNFSAGTITASLTGHASLDCALTGCTMSGAIAMGANNITGVGNVASTTFNGNTFTTGTGTLTIAAAKTLTASNTLTFTGTDGSSVAFGAGGTVLYGNQTITLTGDVSGSGTTAITTVLGNIPTGVTAAGTILHSHIAAPSTPASGKDIIWTDSTDLRLHDKNASGVIGTTVVADTGAANNYISAISTAGVITKSRPSCATLSDSSTGCSTTVGTMATQAASAVAITGGTVAGLTGLAVRDTSAAFDVTLAAVSSTTLTAGRTLTLDLGNVAHTLKFGTTANTITFPNLASYTVLTSGDTGSVTSTILANSLSLVTPNINVATGTSLALGGATIGTNALAVTGTGSISGALNSGALSISFNSGSANPATYVDSAAGGQTWITGPSVGTGSVTTFSLYSGAVLQKWSTSGLSTIPGTFAISGIGNTATTSAVCVNTSTGLLTYNGTVGTCTVSDERLKNVSGPITGALEKLLAINGFYYTWKDPSLGAGNQIGVGAQTVDRVFPELVSTDSSGTKSVDYQRLTAPIIEALREMKADNDNLQAEIAAVRKLAQRHGN